VDTLGQAAKWPLAKDRIVWIEAVVGRGEIDECPDAGCEENGNTSFGVGGVDSAWILASDEVRAREA
jgi:hypothetical protein